MKYTITIINGKHKATTEIEAENEQAAKEYALGEQKKVKEQLGIDIEFEITDAIGGL